MAEPINPKPNTGIDGKAELSQQIDEHVAKFFYLSQQQSRAQSERQILCLKGLGAALARVAQGSARWVLQLLLRHAREAQELQGRPMQLSPNPQP